MKQPMEHQFHEENKLNLDDNDALLRALIKKQEEIDFYRRLATINQLDSAAARLVIKVLIEQIIGKENISWREVYRDYGEYCHKKSYPATKGVQKHHMVPVRDGGKGGNNLKLCTNSEHGVLHYLLYRVKGNSIDLQKIHEVRLGKNK